MIQSNGYLWMAVLSTLGLAVTGGWFYAWLVRRAVHIQHSILANWPLATRPLVNVEECQVLHWMCKTFPVHQVNVKIPVTRFTRPLGREQAENLYKLLNGVYCTFTICAPDGRVVGCADVMGVNGPASNNRQLKQALLAKCGIAYCVLRPMSLPAAAAIRSDFLGESVPVETAPLHKSRAEGNRELEEALLAQARLRLSMALNRQRHIRDSDLSPLMPNSDSVNGDNLLPGWQHNSFLVPLSSRPST